MSGPNRWWNISTTDKDAQKLRLVEHDVYANGLQKNVFDVVR